MGKYLQLTINDPCHENWDKMTVAEKGRFCDSCQKQVIDFTRMSDAELVAFFRKKSTGSVCGRFMEDQLNKTIAVPRKRIPWIRYFFQFSLPLFLASMKVNAQRVKKIDKPKMESSNVITVGKVAPLRETEPVKTLPLKISGTVIDDQNKPVPFASIIISGTKNGTQSDSSGCFMLEVPEKIKQAALEVSSVGFETKIIDGKELNGIDSLTVHLLPLSLPEVTVVGYEPIRCGIMMGGVLMKIGVKENNIPIVEKPLPKVSAINVYPNPSSRGENITIELKKELKGVFELRIISLNGHLAKRLALKDFKSTNRLGLQTEISWSAGVYFVQLINEKGQQVDAARFIIQ